MRARAGDPPRTMTQKILAGRADDPNLVRDFVRVKVDHVVLSRAPNRAFAEALDLGMKKCAPEVAVAYETRCVSDSGDLSIDTAAPDRISRAALQYGMLVARPGIGFPAAVHLERFGSPARLALTDEPRLASVGGAGMLTLTVSPAQLGEALVHGSVLLRPQRSVQVLLSGKLRPFVCVRDVALELLRRGLAQSIRAVDEKYGAPVVLEFAGPSARLLSVAERAVLCALAPQLGAAGALFVSDEKTEVYLRDQRRSKAHRSLLPDPGAPCDDVITVDLSAIDPLIMDEAGEVRAVRELAGKPVYQVVIGGDAGAPLRDLLAAAALLKSKRVPPRLDLLLAPPSRQALEVLAQSGALVDLIATGARLIEPDQRVLTSELYPPVPGGLSLRTFDPEPGLAPAARFAVGSAETLAYAVASGQIGDPRSFKRPVRVTVPRSLPTDDVLIVRKGKTKGKAEGAAGNLPSKPPGTAPPFGAPLELSLFARRDWRGAAEGPVALLLASLDDARWFGDEATRQPHAVRAVIAPALPAHLATLLAAVGVAALQADERTCAALAGKRTLRLPALATATPGALSASADDTPVELVWRAVEDERQWVLAGGTKAAAAPAATPKSGARSS